MPIFRRSAFTSTLPFVTVSPSTTIVPVSTCSSTLMQRRSVDFPEPEAPIRQTTLCNSTLRSMSFRTVFSPKDFVTFWIATKLIRRSRAP